LALQTGARGAARRDIRDDLLARLYG